MKKDIIVVGAMLLLILVVSQVKGQDCNFVFDKLPMIQKDTVLSWKGLKPIFIETGEEMGVSISFKKRVPIITMVNNTELTYTGLWEHPSGTWGTISHSSTPGATAKYIFTGNHVDVFGTFAPHHGVMEYQINSGTPKSINLASPVRQDGVLMISEPVPSGFNTISFKCISGTVLIDYLRITN